MHDTLTVRAREEVRVIGRRWSRRVHELKSFLARGRIPYRWLDADRDPDARRELDRLEASGARLPVVIFADGSHLVDPDVRTVAERVGLDTEPDARFYDLVIVGGGPAGLSAGVYAASEGLHTVIVEREVPGGQATHSASIENYPGFPHGLSGSDFARRTVAQAERFGVEILSTRTVVGLQADGEYPVCELDDGARIASHAVLLATGVAFRWLDAPGCPMLVGRGIYYGAAIAEASAFAGQDVFLLGAGNSAGQAALHLAAHARQVIILALEDTLEETMSQYLVERIRESPNIAVRTNHTVIEAQGSGHLERLTIQNTTTGETERTPATGLFIFIGASPQTEWLEGVVERDENGFVYAGTDLTRDRRRLHDWPLERDPFLLETSAPGVFVAGDVRAGSAKRLASAVGEGAMVVQFVHAYRAER